MGAIIFVFVISLSNEIAGSMLPVMYFPLMLVSMYSTVELWFILFLVPLIGNFIGVYVAVSMNHTDENEETVLTEDIIYNASEIKNQKFVNNL